MTSREQMFQPAKRNCTQTFGLLLEVEASKQHVAHVRRYDRADGTGSEPESSGLFGFLPGPAAVMSCE